MNQSKILFISDIHGITDNLDKITLLEKNINFSKILVLGDLFTAELISRKKNTEPEKVKEFLKKYKEKIICLKGNNDLENEIKELKIVFYLDYYVLETDNLRILCTHGDNLNEEIIYKESCDLVVFGHEHRPYITEKNNKIYVCVGSVSLPADNFEESYAIYFNGEIFLNDLNNSKIISKKIERK